MTPQTHNSSFSKEEEAMHSRSPSFAKPLGSNLRKFKKSREVTTPKNDLTASFPHLDGSGKGSTAGTKWVSPKGMGFDHMLSSQRRKKVGSSGQSSANKPSAEEL